MKRPMRARLVAILIAVPLVAMLLAATALAAPNKPDLRRHLAGPER